MAQTYHPGTEVEYFSGSMNQWIPARVLRRGQTPGTYDLDCKDAVGTDRIRMPVSAGAGQMSFGQPSQTRSSSGGASAAGAGAGPLGLRDGEACFYKSSTHGWITAQVVRFRPEDQSYDLDVKSQVVPQSIFRLREGCVVEYHSTSSNSWIPARVVRPCADGSSFDLDCKEEVLISRIRPPKDAVGGAAAGAGGGGLPQFGGKGGGYVGGGGHAAAGRGGGYGGGRLAPLPESGALDESDASKQQKLDQLRAAMYADDPEAIKRRLESTSALSLRGEEALDQAGHKLWALNARPGALAELQRAAAGTNKDALEAAIEAAVAAGVSAAEIDVGRQALKRIVSSPIWIYDPPDGHHIDVRAGPAIDGKRVRVRLNAGDMFCTSLEQRGEDGVTYLQLADSRGWLFDKKPGVGAMCRRHVVPGNDSPGTYTIIHDKTAITPTEALGKDDEIVGKLAYGATVNIIQVVNKMGCHRIRGRLENPMGWISLVDTESGRRWAVKQARKGRLDC